jgi:site-specific DNA-methyltransferase (adenine-specific)
LNWDGRKTVGESGEDRSPARIVAPTASYATEDGGSWLLQGENLGILRWLARTQAGSVALAYLDPPFFTNREHAAFLRKAGAPRGSARVRAVAFDDRWRDLSAFLEALGARLDAVRDLLAPYGSIVVHVDPKTSHYVKVLGDEIFGPTAFASEIVWRYRRWPSKTPNFQRVHDVLLRWRKDPRAEPRWNQPYEALSPSTLATWGINKQRAVFTRDGRRARSSSTAERTAGVPMGDVWDIGVIAPVAKERTGYPSQKPELLLERLVGALSDPGDLVLDPYAGSGTTLAVARRMGRNFIGVDSSPVALDVARARLDALGATLDGERRTTNRMEKCEFQGMPPTERDMGRNLAFRALPGNTR